MNYLDWFKEFYAQHPSVVLGVAGGAAVGLGFAAFGFWRTLVVLLCVGAGLFVGLRVDSGEDVLEGIKAFFRRK